LEKYNPAIHRNPERATSRRLDQTSGRVETVINKNTGQQQFVLDRKQVLRTEDGFALSTGRDKLISKCTLFSGADFSKKK